MKTHWLILLNCLLPLLAISLGSFMPIENTGFIMTVTGKLPTAKMGLTLPHEHIVTDFGGAETNDVRYTEQEAIAVFLPHLTRLKASGVKTLVDCTPSYIGKNVKLLASLSRLTGIQIITNTGYYAAVGQKYLPKHAFTESAETLSNRWIVEFKNGIDGTDIKPGFIKLGTDAAPLNEVAIKIIKAGAITHLRTGLKIAIHTGNADAALEEAAILEEMGVPLSSFIWVHAQNDSDANTQLALAKRGVWISLDGINEKDEALEKYITAIKRMKSAKLLHRLLLSQDDGFSVSLVNNEVKFDSYANGNKTAYNTIFTVLKPRLLAGVLTQDEFDLVTIKNPAEAYKIKK